jgi:parvulin-like peptidyl-prolyl isomerase
MVSLNKFVQMDKKIDITAADIVKRVKLSGKMPETLEKIIIREIIVSNCDRIGIQIKSQELQKAADEFRLERKLQKATATWNWLKESYLFLDDFQELIYLNLLSNKLCERLFFEKIEPYFEKHQKEYESAVLSEIVLEDLDLASKLFERIKTGELIFFDVASQWIQEPELRRKGGYLGKLEYKDLQPEIAAAVFTATPPQVLSPIVSSKGVHLIKVEEIIKPQLNEALRNKISSDLFSQWLKQEMKEFSVILAWE